MEILPIFDHAIAQGKMPYLFTVHFDGEELNAYEKLYQDWTNVEATRAFLNQNLSDLHDTFWQPKTVDDAVLEIANEADDFEDDLIEVEERILKGESPELVKIIFQHPFYNYYETAPIILKGKAKGIQRPYLRLYGLHLEDEGQILIFGGGIKLTKKVNKDQSPHLLLEIQKAARVKQYLKEQGIQFID